MRIGVRQRLIFLIFFGLFITISLIGSYRYFMEKKAILANARFHGEQSGKLIAEIAAPLLMTYDYLSLEAMARNFIGTPDAQEILITDSGGQGGPACCPSPGCRRTASRSGRSRSFPTRRRSVRCVSPSIPPILLPGCGPSQWERSSSLSSFSPFLPLSSTFP